MNFQVAVSLGTGSVLLVGSSTTTDNADNHRGSSDDSHAPPSLADPRQRGSADGAGKHGDDPAGLENTRLQTRGLVQLRILGGAEDSLDTQETSCYVLEGSNT